MDRKLRRDPENKMIGGVAAGRANYFQLDVTWVRIAFALAAFFGGSGLWIYLILWIAVPEEYKSAYTYTDYRASAEEPAPQKNVNANPSSISILLGFLLIAMGAYFLLGEFDLLPYWFSLRKLWPLVFVVFGLLILSKATKKTNPSNDKPKEEPLRDTVVEDLSAEEVTEESKPLENQNQ